MQQKYQFFKLDEVTLMRGCNLNLKLDLEDENKYFRVFLFVLSITILVGKYK